MTIDLDQVSLIGNQLERPEGVMASRDGVIWCADGRGWCHRIEPTGQPLVHQM